MILLAESQPCWSKHYCSLAVDFQLVMVVCASVCAFGREWYNSAMSLLTISIIIIQRSNYYIYWHQKFNWPRRTREARAAENAIYCSYVRE